MIYLILLPFFYASMLLYFRIADYYNIIDKPNERSSHSETTIRGGGIIYLLAALAAVILEPSYWQPILALFIIGSISFADDSFTLSRNMRVRFHFAAVSLLFYYFGLYFSQPIWLIPILYILVIGIINAYNFMDGINGITGSYSLVVLAGLQYVNLKQFPFIAADLIWLPMLASAVFLLFNFRTKAKCFAGDVGSVTIALWIIMLLMQLIISSGHFAYILFLSVYGVDAVLTIIHRLFLRQNIFEPHRLHFYQILANEQKWSHLLISGIYAALQLLIILAVILYPTHFTLLFLCSTLPLVLVYVWAKPLLQNNKEAAVVEEQPNISRNYDQIRL
ncbi:UDP-N-acetylmuramyl pentapeptide phosphotransferase/UDP-N-acetylglucosamine-1-phosphate transferase [Pedobacter sp. CG_S7]|uniref:MraY family glycosyltransferase n=1 Tax=Pedobacter sp. CG_S7 TaxID=3143930 RepID=UPI003393CCD8